MEGHVSQRLPDLEELIGPQARHRVQVGLNLSSCNDLHSVSLSPPPPHCLHALLTTLSALPYVDKQDTCDVVLYAAPASDD